MTCTACGAIVGDGARFCAQCGERLAAPPARDPLRRLLEAALGTHYAVVGELGRGGMGAVYLAHESGLDRNVAIKVLPPEMAHSPEHRERFRREARTAARLTHPGIVPLHAFGEHEAMLYYVMGYVEGESLAERLERAGPVPETEARAILVTLADALQYAHARGVVHRDVKPQNILLESQSGRAMLTDFGVARVTTETATFASVGALVGTPQYMSPEQASGKPVGPASDLYSLGLVAYAMLTGKIPFEGLTPIETLARRLTTPVPPLPSGVREPVRAAVMRCLASDPDLRWPTAGAFAAALSSAGEEETQIPSDLEQIDRSGVLVTVLLYVAVVSQGLRLRFAPAGIALELIAKISSVLAGFGMALLAGTWAYARYRNHASSAFAYYAFREPVFWTTWYPRRLRLPANVWDRLPRDVRVLRLGLPAAIIALMVVIGPLALLTLGPGSSRMGSSPLQLLVSAVVAADMAFAVVSMFLGWLIPRRLVRRGLSPLEARRVAYEAALSNRAFWSRPAVAALLASHAAPPASR